MDVCFGICCSLPVFVDPFLIVLTFIVWEIVFYTGSLDLVAEDIRLVHEHDHRRVDEPLWIADLIKQHQCFLHLILFESKIERRKGVNGKFRNLTEVLLASSTTIKKNLRHPGLQPGIGQIHWWRPRTARPLPPRSNGSIFCVLNAVLQRPAF